MFILYKTGMQYKDRQSCGVVTPRSGCVKTGRVLLFSWTSTKSEMKSFFPIIKDRLSKSLHMGINLSTILTGHSTLRSYYHRFKIIDDPNCVCKMGPQTSHHLLWECELLRQQREVLKNSITKAGGDWPLTNSDLANKHTKLFQMFVNSINFETLWLLKSTILIVVQE
jgi:hypothetical protein